MVQKRQLGIGLIGSGFMGRAHTLAFAIAERAFDLPCEIVFHTLADVTDEQATKMAGAFGYRHATGDWRTMLDNPDIDVIDITTPNTLHCEMALAAIAAGKHVYCEKPLAPTVAEAERMTDAAEAAGIVTQVGFNYLKNPLFERAREIIVSGELGEIRHVRGVHAEDFMTSPSMPWSWRLDPSGGGGSFADMGSHVVAGVRHLAGPITEVMGDSRTLVSPRPLPDGSGSRAVEVDDITRAHVVFESGAVGNLESNWLGAGRKMQLAFEVYGEKGGIAFDCERLNELQYYRAGDRAGERGFSTILMAPEHEPYANFCVAPGHQIGFNEVKAIEARDFLAAVCGGPVKGPDFREGLEVHKVVDAVYRSSKARSWLTVT